MRGQNVAIPPTIESLYTSLFHLFNTSQPQLQYDDQETGLPSIIFINAKTMKAAGPLPALSFDPKLIMGQLADYPCRKHTTFWGDFDWPSDCFDPWDRDNPRHPINQCPATSRTRAAENFIKINEMRHLVYGFVASSINTKPSECASLIMICKTINMEFTKALLQARCAYIAKQREYWWNKYSAPVLISDPLHLCDIDTIKIQLQASMFRWKTHLAQEVDFGLGLRMMDLPLAHLIFSIYWDFDPRPWSAAERLWYDLLSTYVGSINSLVTKSGKGLNARNITFTWPDILPDVYCQDTGALLQAGGMHTDFLDPAEWKKGDGSSDRVEIKNATDESFIEVVVWKMELKVEPVGDGVSTG